MKKSDQKLVKGCLQVVALVDTKRGCGDETIPAGTLGYVLAERRADREYLIKWNMKFPAGDWGTSAHSAVDVTPTGERG